MPDDNDQLDGEDQPVPGENDLIPVPRDRDGNGDVDESDEATSTPGGRSAFITELKSIEVQVGENIVQALRHEEAAAVLTFVQPSPGGGQRLVTIPVNLETLVQFQELLQEPPAKKEVPCIGFHCVLDSEKQPFLRDDEDKASKAEKKEEES